MHSNPHKAFISTNLCHYCSFQVAISKSSEVHFILTYTMKERKPSLSAQTLTRPQLTKSIRKNRKNSVSRISIIHSNTVFIKKFPTPMKSPQKNKSQQSLSDVNGYKTWCEEMITVTTAEMKK